MGDNRSLLFVGAKSADPWALDIFSKDFFDFFDFCFLGFSSFICIRRRVACTAVQSTTCTCNHDNGDDGQTTASSHHESHRITRVVVHREFRRRKAGNQLPTQVDSVEFDDEPAENFCVATLLPPFIVCQIRVAGGSGAPMCVRISFFASAHADLTFLPS